ncbi:hypothetical protein V6Z11_D13G137500 [Gossypium hirsutum]
MAKATKFCFHFNVYLTMLTRFAYGLCSKFNISISVNVVSYEMLETFEKLRDLNYLAPVCHAHKLELLKGDSVILNVIGPTRNRMQPS